MTDETHKQTACNVSHLNTETLTVPADGTDMDIHGAVPLDTLRALVNDWRRKQRDCDLPRTGLTDEGVAYKKCADELESVIERHD